MTRNSLCILLCAFFFSSAASAQAEKKFSLYFQHNTKEAADQGRGDSSAFPVQVYPVARSLRTSHIEREALALLLKGPSIPEREAGYQTNCSGLQLKRLKLSRTNAFVYLTGKLQLQGLLSGPRLRLQVEKTLKQFPPIKHVVIYINNKKNFDDLR
jgi:hypothetical protein